MTYGALRGALASLVDVLRRRDGRSGAVLNPGDVAAIAMPNSLAFVGTFLSVALARAVAAPLNPKYTADEFAFFLRDQRATVLFLPARNASAAAIVAARTVGVRVLHVDATVVASGGDDGALILSLHDGPAPAVALASTPPAGGEPPSLSDPPRPSDAALLLHTSGTTSRPKAVPLLHANLAASIGNIVRTLHLGPCDRTLLVMPLFHVHGLMCGLLASLASGCLVAMPEGGAFSASSFWRDATRFRITWYTAVPTIHQVLLLRAARDYPAAAPPPSGSSGPPPPPSPPPCSRGSRQPSELPSSKRTR